ncbi:MAG: RNA-binding S4 domain-containing protein [Acidobacteriota bacterium]
MDARIDKWLWAVRIFKTRSKASEACKSGKVSIDGSVVKPSRILKPDEIVEVNFPPIIRKFRVKSLAVKRVSAKLARELVEETTPEKELEKLRLFYKDPVSVIFGYREKGAGRPTKKERRDIEKIKEKG